MVSPLRSRASALALAAAVAMTTVIAAPAAAATEAPSPVVDAASRPPVATPPGGEPQASLSPAEVAEAERRQNARVEFADQPQLTPAATATITGILRYQNIDAPYGPFPAQTDDSWVRLWWLNVDTGLLEWQGDIDTFGPNGEFTASGLPAGDYWVEFTSYEGDWPVREYWNDEPFWYAAESLDIIGNTSVDLGTVTLIPEEPEFFRVAGDDRYATAVKISQALLPGESTAPVVYLVTGANYADALSAGPAAARSGGVLLLTAAAALPELVALEIDRINPERIVVVGGPSIISDAVLAQLRTYVNAPGDVERIYGADRYVTSRLIVADAFPDGVPNLFVATGRNFPDALAAGPAASYLGGGVLLVDGNLSAADQPTRALITELGKPDIFLAGGTGVISAGMSDSLAAHIAPATVTRYAGANRYDTAYEMNWKVFSNDGIDFAFIATGTTFPDALAGGPLAAVFGAPLYLSSPVCLRDEEYWDIVGMLAKEVYLLGGTGALSDRVLNGPNC